MSCSDAGTHDASARAERHLPPPHSRTCVRMRSRRAARALRVLVPRRRVAARGARDGRGRARARGAGADRPRHGLGLDGVRAGGAGARAAGDPRGRERRRSTGRAGTSRCWSATSAGWRNLCRLLTRAHAHTRDGRRRGATVGAAGACRSTRSRSTRRGSSACPAARATASATSRRCAGCCGASGRDGFRVELQRPFARHDRTLNRGLAALARGWGSPCVATGDVHAHTRERARLQDAFVAIREHTTLDASEPLRRGNHATCSRRRRRWLRASPTIPRRWRRPSGWPTRCTFDLSQDLGYRYPGAEDAGRRPRARGASARRASTRATRRGTALHDEAAARLDEELRVIAALGPVGVLPPAPRPARARARGGGRGPRAGIGARAAAARPRPRVLGLVDRLLPHRPLARRPDRQQAAARALPQRGDHLAARHRPRLPARHPRGPDPARARALRPRALGARRRLPDLPRARRDPRARQGARPAAGGDRARRARHRRAGRRARSTRTSTSRWGRARARAAAGRGWPRCPTRRTGCRATCPSTPAG